jgi:serine/threonine protein phosphatase 1
VLSTIFSRLAGKILSEDTLVFLGDYIDRGTESKACIARVVDLQRSAPFNVVALLGNHEQWLLQTYRDPTRHSWLLGMEGLTTIRSYSVEAADALAAAIDQLGFRIVQDRLALGP